MNCANVVSSTGLVLDIVGVALIFKYGLSADVSKTGADYLVWGGGSEETREYRHYKRMSRIGLGCLMVGFALQLASNFLG